MEKVTSLPGSRQSNLKKSFNRSLRSLLTACSDEDFNKAFPSFNGAERERLHKLFIQVISSLHEDVQEEFESIFLETQAGPILDNIEELVEEHKLDPLISKKSNVGETTLSLSDAKRNELKYLTGLLGKAEEQKRQLKDRIELLKKQKQDFSGTSNFADELRTSISNYETSYRTKLLDL